MKKAALVFGIAAITFIGCKNGEKKETTSEEKQIETVDTPPPAGNEMKAIGDNSENALDWAGIYGGTTPCADCKGIKTVLELNNDKTFVLTQTYLGKPERENEFKETGNFVFNQDGSMIRLRTKTGGYQYRVGENQLIMLDVKGNTIEGDMAAMYILKKKTE